MLLSCYHSAVCINYRKIYRIKIWYATLRYKGIFFIFVQLPSHLFFFRMEQKTKGRKAKMWETPKCRLCSGMNFDHHQILYCQVFLQNSKNSIIFSWCKNYNKSQPKNNTFSEIIRLKLFQTTTQWPFEYLLLHLFLPKPSSCLPRCLRECRLP